MVLLYLHRHRLHTLLDVHVNHSSYQSQFNLNQLSQITTNFTQHDSLIKLIAAMSLIKMSSICTKDILWHQAYDMDEVTGKIPFGDFRVIGRVQTDHLPFR